MYSRIVIQDEHALPGRGLDEPFGLQTAHRIPHRRPAHAELATQLLQPHPATRVVMLAEYEVAETSIDLFTQAFVGDWRQRQGVP